MNPDPSASAPRRGVLVAVLGVTQIFAWGSSYYLPAVLAVPIAASTGWSRNVVFGGLSLGLLVSGLVSPSVGRAIERHGGRPVLATSALLLAAGLTGLAAASGIAAYLAAWVVIGLGMGAGLYDPAFATLGRLYGEQARLPISMVTLYAGFSSTVCWPLSAFLGGLVGWRGACLAYAALHIFVILPLYLIVLPREARAPHEPDSVADEDGATDGTTLGAAAARPDWRLVFTLLAVILTLASISMTLVAVHLLAMLAARGVSESAAVGLGALMGPSQVAARVIEMLLARRRHPIWTMLAGSVLVAVGIGMLLISTDAAIVGIVLYGAGNGIRSIARGTLPLAMVGRRGYATLMGRLALPSLIAQAATPSLGAAMLDRLGASATLLALFLLAVANLVPVLLLLLLLLLLPRTGASRLSVAPRRRSPR